jgi:hypothetical protein
MILKKAGHETQVAEHLASKHKVVSSNPNTDKKLKESIETKCKLGLVLKIDCSPYWIPFAGAL